MPTNPHKTISASSTGIVVSFKDVNKHKFQPYESRYTRRIQTAGTPRRMETEQPYFNKVQQRLYAEVVYGLSYFQDEQLKSMSRSKKLRILARYNKAQRLLNRYKQQIVSHTVDAFLLELFPNSPITKIMVDTQGYSKEVKTPFTFKELGMTQQHIAEKLVEASLLPKSFFTIC
jgi:hypothetical protein